MEVRPSTSRGAAPVRRRLPDRVTIVEVGPRDGLQNEAGKVPAALKIQFIERLAASGLSVVEATSFVSPRWVPQLADAAEVLSSINRLDGVRYPVLVPNLKGLERAMEAGATEVSIFASATESFSQRNLNATIEESLDMFRPVVSEATSAGMRVRGYLSMVIGDPWEGLVSPLDVVGVGEQLLEMGCSELSLGDTIGVGTPSLVQELIANFLMASIPVSALAVHFHDTYGQALSNVLAAMEMGVNIVDASAGGLGGCPFAHSATGNLATEDLLFMLDGLEIRTGVDIAAVASASVSICRSLGIPIPGRVARAMQQEDDDE